MTSTTRPTRHDDERARIADALAHLNERWIIADDESDLYTTHAAAATRAAEIGYDGDVNRVYTDNDEQIVDVGPIVQAVRDTIQAERDDVAIRANSAVRLGRPDLARMILVAEFENLHAEHPQYAGWTDRAVLVRVRDNFRTPSTTFERFRAGDVLLAEPFEPTPLPFCSIGPERRSAFAPRVGWNVSVSAAEVEPID